MAEEADQQVCAIASPLAGPKLVKRLLKLVKTASKEKQVRRGVKEVVKALKKSEKGLCIIAGDISPIDVISHIPVMCEDRNITYVYVPSKEALGTAGQTKRPTSVMLVKKSESYSDKYSECAKKAKALEAD
eukprot:CAMPEP_0117047848 /NCGR_PEP_ID=MMETSP0472-20121206/33051_1 /TAXON_ID=693140 ORGANISM="Tiarina fusus, Strain LIS" /NCGR_SAMPLE_ID=MMETSP0472 /ASSEMBLY_ACC=CAM_ASM_000603 /LENGTH=130 /DNA_ID=CAMNT_0004760673 /DNA_START=9 /DNA_END=401 /DNA_ORIENTATION=+